MGMRTSLTTTGRRRRGRYGLIAGGLLSAVAASLIASPMAATANAAPGCNQTFGDSINSYLEQHPALHQELIAKSEAAGNGPNVIEYLNQHPDVRQHLIDLSQQCVS